MFNTILRDPKFQAALRTYVESVAENYCQTVHTAAQLWVPRVQQFAEWTFFAGLTANPEFQAALGCYTAALDVPTEQRTP